VKRLLESVVLFPDWDQVRKPRPVKKIEYILPWSLSTHGVTEPSYIDALDGLRRMDPQDCANDLISRNCSPENAFFILSELIDHGDLRKAADIARRISWERSDFRRELLNLKVNKSYISILFDAPLGRLPSCESEFSESSKRFLKKLM